MLTVDALNQTPAVQRLVAATACNEVERMLLGALLNFPAAWGKAMGRVDAGDFFDPAHARLFAVIAERRGAGRTADAVLMADLGRALDEELQDHGGGMAYIAQLVATACPPMSVPDYADQVRDAARRRRLMDAALAALVAAAEGPDVDDAISTTISTAESLIDGGRSKTRAEVLRAAVAAMEKPASVYSTGLPALDRVMGGGLEVGRMYAICGRGKSGKSLLAGTISANLNRDGIPHAYAAFEMGSTELELRSIARDLGVNSMALRGAVPTALLSKAVCYTAAAPDAIRYIDLPGGTADRLRSEVLTARHRHGCTGIILDYWQLVGGRDRAMSEEEHLRRVAEWLAAAAKRLSIWVLVLAQLADDGEATAVSRTGLTRNADQVFFIRGDADSNTRWLEMRASRFTPVADVGSQNRPAFAIEAPGPHFRDLSTLAG
ncbi:DnaB-like helicase C-terminal domain-containing protein [Nitrospirillum amazonense]|uniref:DnaB-like helicase C-terminal domain-containing protein n=1 Tax=Nitrospirillum amazonense TaxID=28077 RepID=UPI002DD443DF|nr:DnaB-like helicase C-terminal domain-containing protein [Nitrospirillum amazonense]MEC4590554.1 DnaB-like helicase C-terminal domain-containing protein [Nitrospirillum amazonense]